MSWVPGSSFGLPATLTEVLRGWAERQPTKRLYTFLAVGDGEAGEHLAYGELDCQARALAARLQELRLAGERALLLYPQGLEFIAAFLGCLYAGVVAVPASLGRANRPGSRLRALAADARPRAVLTTAALLSDSETWTAQVPELEGLRRVSTDDIDGALAERWRDPRVGADELAFLQYTSGSTATPKGVMVTHDNLVENSELIRRCFGTVPDGEGVTWLPFHHDMGLIGGLLQALYCGASCTLLSPAAFLQRPLRWIEAIAQTGALVSGGPNFAYDLCASKATPQRISGLDLSAWRVAFNGAEPVRAATLDRFAEAFAPCGFRREAFFPCYGMAETTLMVSGGPWQAPPVVLAVRATALEQGRVVPANGSETGSRDVVGCGQVPESTRVVVADPETGTRAPEGTVGEVWVAGPSVAAGYWGRRDETEQTFGARLADKHDGPFLRTGDLGFVREGELFITGRLKDLIIVRGRNVYPQDVEYVAGNCHPALRADAGAAFAIEAGGQERLVVVQEVERRARDVPSNEVIRAIREAVAEQLELDVYAVVLIRMLSLPRTSSGKVQRHVCRARFLEGGLDEVARSVVEGADEVPDVPAPAFDGPPIARTADEIRNRLVTRLAAILGVARSQLDVHQPLDGSGLTSLQVIGLAGELQEWLGRSLSPTLVYEYPTIDELARYLAGEAVDATSAADALPTRESAPIAIVGIGCRFPGADGPEAFWRLLREGVDAVGDVPAGRWEADGARGRAGFIDGLDRFDADFFGISPREAARTDPQQRLLLEVAWEALEDVGQPVERLAGTPVGVFVGISTRDYGLRLGDEPAEAPGAAGFRLTGNAGSIAANRLSYTFDFRGPSLAIDTACSSSLVAVHAACAALQDGEATLALAGGVNLMLAPEVTERLAQAGFLSAEGRCKAFDAGADGYARGEGAGLVVLKPLAHAEADGDRIYAVIRGGAVNQDGRTVGLTVPSRKAQEAVLRAAYRRAGVDPATVQYVEAHGTGTLLGDPIEAKALGAVIGAGRPAANPCLVGSVKTNVGHLEAAAGVAGLIKLALALAHREVPPNLHYGRPNPHIPFGDLHLSVARAHHRWPEADGPARAGVSSFGFGGTNAHVVLEGVAPAAVGNEAEKARDAAVCLLPLSARHPESLRDLARAYRAALAEGLPGTALRDIAAAAGARRDHHDHRLAIAARTRDEAVTRLDAFLAGDVRPGIFTGERPPGGPPRLAFVFPGEGSLARDACLYLLEHEPAFRAGLEQCDGAFRPLAGCALAEALRADNPETAQPLFVAVQVALAHLWRSWGMEASAVVGHGLGEIAAAAVAGALSLPDALRLAAERGRLVRALAGAGRTMAVEMPADEARLLTSLLGDRLTIAAVNGPTSVVLSGDADVLDQIGKQVAARGASSRSLHADVAVYGPRMEPVPQALATALDGLRPAPAQVAFVSGVTGRVTPGRELDAGYWGRQVREPIQFLPALDAAVAEGCTAFLEVGALPMLSTAIAQHAGVLVAGLRPREDGRPAALDALGTLYAAGFPVAWETINPPRRFVRLPSYPWRRRRYWMDGDRAAAEPAPAPAAPADAPELADTDAGDTAGLLYELQWPAKERGQPPPAELDGDWLILEDGRGAGRALSRLLEDRGAECCLVRARRAGRADQGFGPSVDPADGEALRRLFAEPAGGRPYRGVVYLWGLDAADPGSEHATAAEVAEAQARACEALSELARAVSPGTRLWVVTRGAQPVAPGQATLALLQAALWGAGRALANEFGDRWGGLIDLDPATPAGEATALLAELAAPDGGDQVAFRNGVRHVARLARCEVAESAVEPLRLSAAETYVIAGGAGRVQLHLARWLVDRGARRLVLVGLEALPDRNAWSRLADGDSQRAITEAILELERQGVSVFVFSVDLADDTAMDALGKALRDELPPIRGIVHAPGADRGQLRRAVAAAWNVRRLAVGLPLDCFIAGSSVASILGREPYAAAAYSFLDALAHAERRRGVAARSVNWGPWNGIDAPAPPGADHAPALVPLAPARAIAALERLIGMNAAQAVVADFDWRDTRAGTPPLFERFHPAAESTAAAPPAAEPVSGDWQAMPPERRRDWLLAFVRVQVATALEQAPEEVSTDRPLTSLGVDSLTAMEIKWAVEDGLGITLPLATLADGPSIAQLVDRALESVASGDAAAPAHATETTSQSGR